MTTFSGPDLDDTPGIGALTLGGFLDEIVERSGDDESLVLNDALRGGATVRWPYRRLGEEAHRLAAALVDAGVEPGESVGVLMGNRPEAVASLFAAALVGAIAVPMSTFATLPEIVEMIDRTSAVVVLTQRQLGRRRFADEVTAAVDDLPTVRCIAAVGTDSWDAFGALGMKTSAPHDEVALRAAKVSPDDPAVVIFTSGTTTRPKAILHAHRAVTVQSWLQAGIFGRTRQSRVYSALPLFWTAGLNTALGATLAAGGCLVMDEVFDAGSALRLISAERVTEPYTLPHQTMAVAEHPDWFDTDLSSLRSVFGKSAYARHPTVDGDTGWIMPVGYGLSEMCAFVSAHRSDASREEAKRGSGRVLPGVRVRILDVDSGAPLGPDVEGEIAVAGPMVMLGYLDDDRPAGPLDADGFFHTGDLGSMGPDGVLHYSGRLTEMIKTGGANVSPAEIEVQLRRRRDLKLSRVIGIPDERLGEVVVACVVASDGVEVDPDSIRSFLRERLASYKVPRYVLVVADGDMPMTSSGNKVRDDELIRIVADRLATATPMPGGL